MTANGVEQSYDIDRHPIEIIDLTHFKEARISYGKHLPFVKQIPNFWATQNRVIPQDWKELVIAILNTSPKLQ